MRVEAGQIVCPGAYNDDIGSFVRCYFKATPTSLERLPWRTSPKSTAEREAETTFKATVVDDSSNDLFSGLDMDSLPGKKMAAERLLNTAKERGINVPDTEQEAKVRFGSLVMSNPGGTANELLALAEQVVLGNMHIISLIL